MIRSGRLPLWNGHAGCGAPHLANGQSAVFDPFHLLAYLGRLRRHSPGSQPAGCGWLGWGCSCWPGSGDSASGDVGLPVWSIHSVGSWSSGFCSRSRRWRSGCPGCCWRPIARFGVPGPRSAGWLAVVVAFVILGGHIQTSAHVLLAGGHLRLDARLEGPSEPRHPSKSDDHLGDGDRPGPGSGGRPDSAAGLLSGKELRSGAIGYASRLHGGQSPALACSMPSARRFRTPMEVSAGVTPTWPGPWVCTT